MSGDDDWFERALRERDEADSDDESDRAAANGARDVGDTAESDDDAAAEGRSTPFDDDFATAFQNAPSPNFDGEAASPADSFDDVFDGPEGFDESEFESDLARIDIGIEGLDEMILGGVPERSLMVALGSPGTGKTTFGLQFLNHSLADGGRGVYITLEETRQRVLDTAGEKGWPFDEYEEAGHLAIVDLDPVEMANSLGSIQNDLPRLIREFDADRLVLDSVSLLEMMSDHASTRRTEVFDFTTALKDAGVTAMLTSEADDENPYASRYGIVEYLADAVFVLRYVRASDFRETRLAVEIQKIRDANHSRDIKPYEITDDGLSVYQQATIF